MLKLLDTERRAIAVVEDIGVRLANLSDLKAVQEISAEAYISAYQGVLDGIPRPASEDYSERIERKEVWVLSVFDEIIGVAVLEPMPDHVLIYSLAVRPRHQGRGYGKALIAFAERQASQAGLFEMRLYTNSRMVKNLTLYLRWGFAEVGRRPHLARPGEVLVDMAKSVSPV